jgi:hypothetical protein
MEDVIGIISAFHGAQSLEVWPEGGLDRLIALLAQIVEIGSSAAHCFRLERLFRPDDCVGWTRTSSQGRDDIVEDLPTGRLNGVSEGGRHKALEICSRQIKNFAMALCSRRRARTLATVNDALSKGPLMFRNCAECIPNACYEIALAISIFYQNHLS